MLFVNHPLIHFAASSDPLLFLLLQSSFLILLFALICLPLSLCLCLSLCLSMAVCLSLFLLLSPISPFIPRVFHSFIHSLIFFFLLLLLLGTKSRSLLPSPSPQFPLPLPPLSSLLVLQHPSQTPCLS